MRKPMIWLSALVFAVTAQAQDFTRTMTAEEQAAAGLEKLSTTELATLKAAVERYKAGAVAVVQEKAEQKVAAAEVKAKEAEQKVTAAAGEAEKKKGPGWLSALVGRKKVESQLESEDAIESRLVGTIRNFSGRRSFTLENGQVWQMIETGSYAGPSYDQPMVRVRPGAFGAFWLQISEAALSVKVKPVKLE